MAWPRPVLRMSTGKLGTVGLNCGEMVFERCLKASRFRVWKKILGCRPGSDKVL